MSRILKRWLTSGLSLSRLWASTVLAFPPLAQEEGEQDKAYRLRLYLY